MNDARTRPDKIDSRHRIISPVHSSFQPLSRVFASINGPLPLCRLLPLNTPPLPPLPRLLSTFFFFSLTLSDILDFLIYSPAPLGGPLYSRTIPASCLFSLNILHPSSPPLSPPLVSPLGYLPAHCWVSDSPACLTWPFTFPDCLEKVLSPFTSNARPPLWVGQHQYNLPSSLFFLFFFSFFSLSGSFPLPFFSPLFYLTELSCGSFKHQIPGYLHQIPF